MPSKRCTEVNATLRIKQGSRHQSRHLVRVLVACVGSDPRNPAGERGRMSGAVSHMGISPGEVREYSGHFYFPQAIAGQRTMTRGSPQQKVAGVCSWRLGYHSTRAGEPRSCGRDTEGICFSSPRPPPISVTTHSSVCQVPCLH